MEHRAQTYLTQLQSQIQVALEQRGYQDIRFRPLDSPHRTPDVAGALTLLVLMRLPLDGLKSPVFRVQLPLAVSYAGKLTVQGAQINQMTLSEPFVAPLTTDPAHLAEQLVQGLGERYMTYLLQAGSILAPAVQADPRRQYFADLE